MMETNNPTQCDVDFSHARPWPDGPAPSVQRNDTFPEAETELAMAHAKSGIVASLYASLRAKHGPAASHSLRVALWASAWGVQNQVPDEQLQLVEVVGLLHEIGKIGIPDRVLQKPEMLNENEQAMMDLHTQVGLEILKAAGASCELLLAIAGIGTSFGSSSESHSNEIASLASRLINIIDAYDSMKMRQGVREPVSNETALAELFRLGGSQYDPLLVRSFAEIVLNPQPELHVCAHSRWLAELDSNGHSRFFGLNHDPTKNRPTQSECQTSALVNTLNETFYRRMMDHAQDGVIFIDSEFRVLDWNSAAERMTGRTAESVFHKHWIPSLACLCDAQGFAIDESQCPFLALMQTGEKIQKRLTIRRDPSSPTIHVQVEVLPVHNERGSLCGGVLILEDLNETADIEQKIAHLREQASQDQLTKIANRGELNRQLPDFVAYHQRTSRPGSAIICDLDYFKRINDDFSHQAGDEALIVFASMLKDSCRETDFVARYGGEEFVILCGQCDYAEAKKLAESIRKRLHRTPIAALGNACMTASFGVSTILPEDTEDSLIGRADRGLLIAKKTGRDRVVGLGMEVAKGSDSKSDLNKLNSCLDWRSWLTPPNQPVQQFELITNVPRSVALEKLKGFVQEFHATVVHVESGRAVLEVDCRNSPITQIKKERLGKFRLEITIAEVEMPSGGKKNNVKICTLLDVKIFPVRNRDRRSDALLSQVLRLKTALQVYMIACEMDDDIRASIVRHIKLHNDSRY